jgi:hypothetical protein
LSLDGSSDGRTERSTERCWGSTEVIPWDELRLGRKIKPYRGYAHCVDDIRLVSRLLELVTVTDVDDNTVKLLLRSLKFLRLCDYSVEDICSILAHASRYFHDAFELCGNMMDPSEVGNVMVTNMFIAHCYVQDEACPLHVWHQHLFRKYCPLKTLDAAIMRLMEIRGYVLRLGADDLHWRFERLIQIVHSRAPRYDTTSRPPGLELGVGVPSPSAAPVHPQVDADTAVPHVSVVV